MNRTIGFIGCGNIAKSLIAGIIKSGVVERNQVIASNRSTPSLQEVEEQYGIEITTNNIEVAKKSGFSFFNGYFRQL